MKALVIKDCMVLKKALKIWPLLIVIPTIVSAGKYSLMPIFIAAAFAGSTMAYDEQCKWEEYSYMLPYSRFELVVSKYLVNYIAIGVVTVMAGSINLINNLVSGINMSIYAGFDRLILEVSLVLVFNSISMWTQFKYGWQKARFINMISIILIAIFTSLIGSEPIVMEIVQRIMGYDFFPSLIFVLAIVCNIISIKCAMGIEKE